jgi:plasmid segregation protein ParM
MHQLIIRSIDVGYGNTKVLVSRDLINNSMGTILFPSLSPRCINTSDDSAADGFLKKRNTFRVNVNGFQYEVGPDSQKAQFGNESGRMLKEDYCLSDNYKALVYGSLLQINEPHLDVLVLGLPMSTWKQYKDRLSQLMTGHHQITDSFSVEIGKVIVAPQPLGGFYDHGLGIGQFRAMKEQMNLIVDPGFYTLDWLLADGVVPIDARSNAVNNGGMAEIIREVSELVAKDFDTTIAQVGSADRIDKALRQNSPIRLFGQDSSRKTDEYLEMAKKRALDPLLKLVQNVGAPGSIDNIILVGGGSHIFHDLLQKEFPRHKIQIAFDPVFSNVRGFQLIGETWARSHLKALPNQSN